MAATHAIASATIASIFLEAFSLAIRHPRGFSGGLAGFLDATVKNRIPRQPAVTVKGKGKAKNFPLFVGEAERVGPTRFS
jgi:hypothetical protein